MSPRDFTTISPSAKALLVMKSSTALPYARAAADLLFGPAGAEAAREELAKEPASALSGQHFENRYRSIDDALERVGATRVLELASGYSFRGLAHAARACIHYVDTDLPEVVARKIEWVRLLHPEPLAGELRLLPLDGLDAAAFAATVRSIPDGPFAIVQEGLLMYLDLDEKQRLAQAIRSALRSRGGVWITADVYVRSALEDRFARSERARAFLAAHRVEEQKFENWDAARAFFNRAGFTIERRLVPGGAAPSPAEAHHARETWILRSD